MTYPESISSVMRHKLYSLESILGRMSGSELGAGWRERPSTMEDVMVSLRKIEAVMIYEDDTQSLARLNNLRNRVWVARVLAHICPN